MVIGRCGVEARLVKGAVVGSEDGLGPVAGAAGELQQAVLLVNLVYRGVIDRLVVLVACDKAEPYRGLIAEGGCDSVLGVVAVIAEAVGDSIAEAIEVVLLELDDAVLRAL